MDQYVPDPPDRTHPYAGPVHAELADLPPAVVVTAGFDPLRTEGDRYVAALAEAGVQVVHRSYDGAVQGYLTMPDLPLGAPTREQIWTDLRRLLRGEVSEQGADHLIGVGGGRFEGIAVDGVQVEEHRLLGLGVHQFEEHAVNPHGALLHR